VARVGLDAGWHFGSEVGSLGPLPNVAFGALAAVGGAVAADNIVQNVQSDLGNDPAGRDLGAVRLHAETENDDVYEFGNHFRLLPAGFRVPGQSGIGDGRPLGPADYR